ncbi:hypothetical protein PCE1_004861 [Barthelona sp. PCE]
MAIGKNKKRWKAVKRKVDPFDRKEWYRIQAPISIFNTKFAGETVINKTQGLIKAEDRLLGRVFELYAGDLNADPSDHFRVITLRCDMVEGDTCLCNFHGMRLTTDRLRGLIKKRQSLIEGYADVVTEDGFRLRVFAIGFTNRHRNQIREGIYSKNYANAQQTKKIREAFLTVIREEVEGVTLSAFLKKVLTKDSITKKMVSAANKFYPVKDVYISKIKTLKGSTRMTTDVVRAFHSGSAPTAEGQSTKRD